jgi:hypothetical protein
MEFSFVPAFSLQGFASDILYALLITSARNRITFYICNLEITDEDTSIRTFERWTNRRMENKHVSKHFIFIHPVLLGCLKNGFDGSNIILFMLEMNKA